MAMPMPTTDSVVGMNIRDNVLRITEAASSGGEWRITKLAQARLSTPWGFSMFKERQAARRLAEDIDRLLETSEVRAAQAVFTLDSNMVFIKKIPVDPNLSGGRLREQVNWEVEQYVISVPNDFVVDFEHQPVVDGQPHANAVVVFVRKTIVDFLKDMFVETRLRLKAIDVDVFAAHRLLTAGTAAGTPGRTALVDVRKENLQFSIAHGKDFFLSQEIDYPVEEEGDLRRREEDHLARVISKELRRILLDHKLGRGIEELSGLILYGEGVSAAVIDALRAMHNIRIELANPFRRLKVTGPIGDAAIQSHPESFVLSVGAAIKAL